MAPKCLAGGRFPLVAGFLGVLCVGVHGAAAQTAAPLGKGTRVRVVIPAADSQPERYLVGSLVRLEGDTVVLASGGLALAGTQTVVLGGERRLEVVAGSRGHGGRGAAVGAALGALTGVIIGAATWRPCPDQASIGCLLYPATRGDQAVGTGALGAIGGALLGLLIGASIRTETWTPLETAAIRVAVARGAVGISLAF